MGIVYNADTPIPSQPSNVEEFFDFCITSRRFIVILGDENSESPWMYLESRIIKEMCDLYEKPLEGFLDLMRKNPPTKDSVDSVSAVISNEEIREFLGESSTKSVEDVLVVLRGISITKMGWSASIWGDKTSNKKMMESHLTQIIFSNVNRKVKFELIERIEKIIDMCRIELYV